LDGCEGSAEAIKMTREKFSENLGKATLRSQEKALALVENELQPPFSYLVRLNQSYDENPLAVGEIIPGAMRLKGSERIGPLSHEEVVGLLWRDSLVPEWIDIIPWQSTVDGAKFLLTCCGRFAKDASLLYHTQEGYPPFHAPGVWSPPEWESLERSGRIDLNWHLTRFLTT
jgi:hypothetical protein